MRSFTLIETLVTVVIFTIIIVALFGLIFYSYRTYYFVWQQSVAVQEARLGVETMVREIREAVSGEDGSYIIEKAGNKEFIFYSDIDKDGEIEKVRYFLGGSSSGSLAQECYSFSGGGSCQVDFSNFLQGDLQSAEFKVSAEGDLGQGSERIEIYADGDYLGTICQGGCSDCAGVWQGDASFDIKDKLLDGNLQLLADSTNQVNPVCDWGENNHSIRVNFELFWEEEISGLNHEFKKGVTNPTSAPVEYLPEQEEISILSSYVRNAPPVFEYFDAQGQKILDYPARLIDTKLMKLLLIVNVDPNRSPSDFELESYVKLRNIEE